MRLPNQSIDTMSTVLVTPVDIGVVPAQADISAPSFQHDVATAPSFGIFWCWWNCCEWSRLFPNICNRYCPICFIGF
jgi:hypothetical protein